MHLSVIIPTLNEEENIEKLLIHLKGCTIPVSYELIVADGMSKDSTCEKALEQGAKVVHCKKMCRAHQMNEGVKVAKGKLLYFIHADARPPKDFYLHISSALEEGFDLGCFRFKFDSKRFLLALNSYFTRFDRIMCRGGDQTLFIKKQMFNELGGYREDYRIMEEYEFILRARANYKFKIIPQDVMVSARKYEENSYLRVNFANFVIFTLFKWGASQEKMIKAYRNLLKHPKAESLT